MLLNNGMFQKSSNAGLCCFKKRDAFCILPSAFVAINVVDVKAQPEGFAANRQSCYNTCTTPVGRKYGHCHKLDKFGICGQSFPLPLRRDNENLHG